VLRRTESAAADGIRADRLSVWDNAICRTDATFVLGKLKHAAARGGRQALRLSLHPNCERMVARTSERDPFNDSIRIERRPM
jgi:hypothetical protein